MEQGAGRETESAHVFRSNGDAALFGVGALADGGTGRSVTTRNQLRARRRGGLCLRLDGNRARHLIPHAGGLRSGGQGFGKAVLAMGNVVVLHSSDGDRRVRAVAGFHGFFSNFAGLLQILFVDTVEPRSGFEFATLGAVAAPVGETVAPCEEEGELDAEPFARGIEAERGGEINGGGHQRDGDNARAGEIKEAHEEVGDEAAGEAGDGQSVEEGGMAGNEAEKRRSEEQAQNDADGFGAGRTGGAGAHPCPAKSAKQDGQDEGGDAFDLQHEVAEVGAGGADPVADGA